ncbi:MAG: helix-turn-helix transcriptional regulator [Alistipes sp.]|nr:helix-turn-helix transcriptional regulator [Alistipes sp.]
MMDVKQSREDIGFSQAELADAVGVTTRTIQNWEAGISSPKPPQVKAIERLLRILPPPAETKEPDTVSRLLAIIESQQRVIESLTRVHNI